MQLPVAPFSVLRNCSDLLTLGRRFSHTQWRFRDPPFCFQNNMMERTPTRRRQKLHDEDKTHTTVTQCTRCRQNQHTGKPFCAFAWNYHPRPKFKSAHLDRGGAGGQHAHSLGALNDVHVPLTFSSRFESRRVSQKTMSIGGPFCLCRRASNRNLE